MATLPTGEALPDYDDPGDALIDFNALHDWLGRAHATWNDGDLFGGLAGRQVIGQVIGALQAVGDATLVRNPTYRTMVRDGADIERLTAWMVNHDMAHAVLQADGNPVDAAIAGLGAVQGYIVREADRLKRLLAEHDARMATMDEKG